MATTKVAKLFRIGRSQAVRLPREFWFQGSEVSIRLDLKTGEVILAVHRTSLKQWFAELDQLNVDSDFMSDRMDAPPQRRKIF